jgi:hypothetical protein
VTSSEPVQSGPSIEYLVAHGDLGDLMARLTADENVAARLPSALATLAVDAAIIARLNDRAPDLVTEARKAGASWAQIGAALGVDRSNAHRRFSHLERDVTAIAASTASSPSSPRHADGGPAREHRPGDRS